MLGKLIKHELKATGKVLLPLHLLLALLTIIGCLLLSTGFLKRTEAFPIGLILIFSYIFSLISIGLINSIYLIVHFYRSLFTAQGYLTFTLPATPWMLLHSKGITGFFWCILDSMMLFGSVSLLAITAAGRNGLHMLSGVFNEFNMTFSNRGETYVFPSSLSKIIGFTPLQILLLLFLFLLISCFCSMAIGYVGVALGQLYTKHKAAASVGAYILVYLTLQIISSLILGFIMVRPLLKLTAIKGAPDPVQLEGILRSIYRPMFPVLIIVFLTAGIICYIVTGIIINKKVNLD